MTFFSQIKWPAIFPFLLWLPKVTQDSIRADLIAGITGAVIVLPQGIAFAIIAGLPPEYGLYTSMVTTVVAALFGSSLHMVSGPATAISIVVFSAISSYAVPGSPEYISLALTLTFLTGIYQLALGLARIGVLVNFVSHTVVVGFTAGAAILIATSQLKNVLSIDIPRGNNFLHTWIIVWNDLGNANSITILIAAVTIAVAVLSKKLSASIPALLVALIAGSILSLFIAASEHGAKMVGHIPSHLPPMIPPDLSFSSLRLLAPDALAVALLGLIEAVSISRSIGAKTHQRIDGTQECIGQGLSNIVGSFFSSYAGSGSFTRSGVNYSAGACTPLSAIFSSLFLILLVIAVAPLAAYLPMAAMGGVILLVAYNLFDLAQIKHVLTTSKSETAILLTTFFATLFLELEFAIYMGVLLSLIVFLARTSTPEIVTLAPDYDIVHKKRTLVNVTSKPLRQCPKLRIIRVDMSIYFGSLNHVQERLYQIAETGEISHVLILASGINFIDLSGVEMLEQGAKHLDEKGGGLYFVGLKASVYQSISKTHIFQVIGNNHFFDNKYDAIHTLRRLIRMQGHCEACTARVFEECKEDKQ